MSWGFVLRFGQGFLEASLTLLVGLIVAGVLRRMLGSAGTRQLFGRGWKGLLRGWFAGMLLPVCSLGVIPVAREMKRAGVPGGTVLAFVLAAPLLNPISFLYGLTLAEPFVICVFAAASLLLSTLAGTFWDRVFGAAAAAVAPLHEATAAEGPRRLLAIAVTAARELIGPNLKFYLLGLAASALLAVALPFGILQPTMRHSDSTSPLLMTAIALPVYSSPLPGMMKIGLMFEHGNSVGASFVLFVLGIGLNVGLVAWMTTSFGARRILPWLAAVVVAVLAFAYVSEPLLFPKDKREEDHTHAFDDYTSPFAAGSSVDHSAQIRTKLSDRFGPLEQTAVGILAALAMLAIAVRLADRAAAVERWLTATPSASDRPTPWYNARVPGPAIAALSILGLIVASVVGAYIYYPPPDQSLTLLSQLRAEVVIGVRTGKGREAIRDLEQMDDVTRKLQVGVYIRRFQFNPGAAEATEAFRETIEEVRDHLLADEFEAAKEKLKDFEDHYRACREAYR